MASSEISKYINMFLEKFAPKTFLGRHPLQKGAVIVGGFMVGISVICVISVAVELAYYKSCENCTALVINNAYSFSIHALFYSIIMIAIHLWFIWGVKNKKSSVVLCWVVITAMWWAQAFGLVVILLCLHVTSTNIGWFIAVVCAVIAFMIFAYCILVGYGYWLEIRKPPRNET